MVRFVYNQLRTDIARQSFDLLGVTLRAMLLTPSYAPNPDQVFADTGDPLDPVNYELSVSGYTPGWGSASRKLLSGKDLLCDNVNDRCKFIANALVWPGLPNLTHIGYLLVVKEGGSADTGTKLVLLHQLGDDSGPLITDGTDLTVQSAATGWSYH